MSETQSTDNFGSDWETDKRILQDVDSPDMCLKRWNVLWHWAKNGNREAKHALAFLVAPPPDMLPMQMPGTHGDTISRLRDILILSVHSIDYQDKDEIDEYYEELTIGLFKQFQLDQTSSGKDFIKCVVTGKSSECARLAVEAELVPSFDDYASNIDLQIANGATATCK